MIAWELPTSLEVGGIAWKIRTDFRAILDILRYFSDEEYEEDERWEICLDILYEDFENMPCSMYEEAMQKAAQFIDMGIKNGKNKPHTMDWEKDASIIMPSVNRVLGCEVRASKYMHWWTFLGAYMEIGESLFSQIVNIRQKKAKGKKLEKWEKEFEKENRELIRLTKKSQRSKEELNEIRELLGLARK